MPVVLFNALATAHYSVSIIIVFAVIILANAAALSLGFLTSRFMGGQKTFSPFLMACGEVGMLGYALILLVVGYDFNPKKEIIKPVFKSMAFRFAIMGTMLILSYFVLFRLIPYEQNQLIALILYFFLPAPLFIPIYTKTKGDSEFLSTSLSMYMAVAILAFIVMAVVFAVH